MKLEELIRQQAEKYMAWAIRDNQQAAVSDDLANRIRLSLPVPTPITSLWTACWRL